MSRNICEVKFIDNPFYEVITHLMEPKKLEARTSYIKQTQSFILKLRSIDVEYLFYNQEVQKDIIMHLRFCVFKTNWPQNDCFPKNLKVFINNKKCSLLINETNKTQNYAHPINITDLCFKSHLSKNEIKIYWDKNNKYNHAFGVFLVKKLTSIILFDRLLFIGETDSEYTKNLIKEIYKQNARSEIITTFLTASLICPLGKLRIETAIRALTCKHLQCFDANSYLKINENTPTWKCPVCDKPALFKNLIIDSFFQDIIKNCPISCNEVKIDQNVTWKPIEKTSFQNIKKTNKEKIETFLIDDDEIGSEVEDKNGSEVECKFSDLLTNVYDTKIVDINSESDAESIKSLPSPTSHQIFDE